MMRQIFTLFLLLSVSITVLLAQPTEFSFIPNYQSMGIIATVEIDGTPASELDWIAAFDENGECVGTSQLLPYADEVYANLQIYGDELITPNTDEGMNEGETFTFKLWVAATSEILEHPICLSPVEGWLRNEQGTPIENWAYEDNALINFRNAEDKSIDCNLSTTVKDYNETILGIYPNPAATSLYISNATSYLNGKIFDATGKLIAEEQNINNKINIQHLNNGLYILELQSEDGVSIHQFIKN